MIRYLVNLYDLIVPSNNICMQIIHFTFEALSVSLINMTKQASLTLHTNYVATNYVATNYVATNYVAGLKHVKYMDYKV